MYLDVAYTWDAEVECIVGVRYHLQVICPEFALEDMFRILGHIRKGHHVRSFLCLRDCADNQCDRCTGRQAKLGIVALELRAWMRREMLHDVNTG